MLDLVLETKKPALIAAARRWLDHEMRLRHVFVEAGLTDDAVKRHLASLREARSVIEQEKRRRTTRSSEVDEFLTTQARNETAALRLMYGDITSRSLMAAEWLGSGRRAVVSPEDTFVSAGGGVAYQLAVNAGPEAILNELTKFAPIPHGAIAVTSGGSLPVHYIFHAAALEIAPNGKYLVDRSDVSAVMVEVLATASALGVGLVLVPLIGTGVAPLQPLESLEALLDGIASWVGSSDGPDGRSPVTVCVVIYQEKQVARADARDAVERVLGSTFDTGARIEASAA
jgi:O-acetyl-ADP-ribose deacetylase